MSFALYERRGAVGLVTLNRPDRMNAISHELTDDFVAAMNAAMEDPEVQAVVLTGSGRAFCAGEDMKASVHIDNDDDLREHIESTQQVTRTMLGAEKPIIGAIHGYAVGGGFEWLLNCDIVVAADDLVAFFPEMRLGYFVTGGVTHLLPLALGYQRTMELVLLGERQSAERLERLGLVNFVVPKAEMLDKALEVASRVAENSPFAMRKFKTALNQTLGAALWTAVDHEEEVTIATFKDPWSIERSKKFAEGRG